MAEYLVGYMYFEGLGVDKDYRKAYSWFIRSKSENACFYLGYISGRIRSRSRLWRGNGMVFKSFKLRKFRCDG